MISFKIVEHNTEDWRKAVNLREQILRKPLGAVFLPWELEEEAKHIHVVGTLEGEIIATAVLVPQGEKMKMQRVAVSEDSRNNNYGSQMIDFCTKIALDNHCSTLFCHARDSAVQFYLKNGWTPEGDYFDEDGIPHIEMSHQIKK